MAKLNQPKNFHTLFLTLILATLLAVLNYLHLILEISYSFTANSLFIILSVFLYVMFKSDNSNDFFSTWKIFIYTFFAFYVFHIFSMQFDEPVFYDYPYEYKTPKILLKSANLFFIGSIMFFLGYKNTQKINASIPLLQFSISSLNNKHKLMLYNYILIFIALVADFFNSYIYMGSIFGRITTNYSSVSLGSLSLLLYLYPVFLTNTAYILMKYKVNFFNKFSLIFLSIIVLGMQFFAGTRSFLFSFFIAAIYLYTINISQKKHGLLKFNSKLRKIIMFMILGFVYLLNVLMQVYRQNKDIITVFKNIKFSDILWKYDTFETYLIVIRHFPDIESYKYFYSIKNILVWVIPRSMYDDKSIAFGKYLAYLVWPSYSNIPSAYAGITFGEFYANFGVLGMFITLFIIGIITGLINKALGDNKLLNAKTLLYAYVLIGLYGFFRGDFTTKTIHFFIPFIFMLIIIFFISFLFTQKNNKI
ncbi:MULTISPECIES: O-antigen polymerase [unclassified Mesobacillus]|uniref:O-antigen polymerase n=1 Tax=unclassified Mesobacillus TaxID=2675270 RepID=UPI00203CD2C2|nr:MULTISPECIES: O-antigen polymerase [unclassified Mesobacillus]MCM3124168.1 oligosaccharide repeat unit polymerase [Mesobacillus sp. MER 33]MCM3234017.1 oligosaccharide repeat unit polymerase [Mesobacillus sp. MER 48]